MKAMYLCHSAVRMRNASAHLFPLAAVIMLTLCATSCSRKKSGDVRVVDELECKNRQAVQPVDSVVIDVPLSLWDWRITQGRVVIHTPEREKFVRVLDYPAFQELYKACEQGRGAGEYISHNWCATCTEGLAALYDIMNATLHVYAVGDSALRESQTFALLTDDEDLCLPFTKMYELGGGRYLAKEDGRSTTLWLVDIGKGQVLDKYAQEVRTEAYADQSYAPFDYDIAVAGDKVLLTYLSAERMELLRIDEGGHLVPEVVAGASNFDDLAKLSDPPYTFVTTCSDGKRFYCLHSSDGGDRGHEVYEVASDGGISRVLNLGREVNNIQCAPDGFLVAYGEQDTASVFYRFKI